MKDKNVLLKYLIQTTALFLSIIFISWGAYTFKFVNSHIDRNWLQTRGRIVSFKSIGIMYTEVAAVVEYKVNNKEYEVISSLSYNGGLGPKINTAKTVAYNPNNPAESTVVENKIIFKLINILTITLGIVLLVFSLYSFISKDFFKIR